MDWPNPGPSMPANQGWVVDVLVSKEGRKKENLPVAMVFILFLVDNLVFCFGS